MSVATADKRLFPRTNDFFSRPSPVSTLEQHVVPLEQYVVPSPRPPRSNLKGHIHDVEGEGGNVVMVVVGWPAPASNHQCRPLLQCGNPGGPGGSYMGHWFLCRGNHRWACIAWACPDREPLPHREYSVLLTLDVTLETAFSPPLHPPALPPPTRQDFETGGLSNTSHQDLQLCRCAGCPAW